MGDSDPLRDITEPTDVVFERRCFDELFFRPDADKTGYYEFQVTPPVPTSTPSLPQVRRERDCETSKLVKFHMESKVKLRGPLKQADDVIRLESWRAAIPWTDFMRNRGPPRAMREVDDEPMPVRIHSHRRQ